MTMKSGKPAPTYTLLIWQEPERTQLFLIPNSEIPHGEARETLRQAHTLFTEGCIFDVAPNTAAEIIDASDRLSAATAEDVAWLPDAHPPGSLWAQRWLKYRIDEGAPIENTLITHVYMSGVL